MNARRDIRVGMAFALVVMGFSIASGQNVAEAAAEVHSGWSVPFDGSDSRPVVNNGVLYVGSFDGAVYAFDMATGQQKWRYQTGESTGIHGTTPTIRQDARAEDIARGIRHQS